MSLVLRVLLVTVAISWILGGEMQPRFDVGEYKISFEARLLKSIHAPVIVQGTVVSVQSIGMPQPCPADKRVAAQLQKITITPEAVIRGGNLSDKLTFYFFSYANSASKADLGRLRYLPEPGQRRVFFLIRENTFLRSIGDVTDYTLMTGSAPRPAGMCNGRTAGCCLAEHLLDPTGQADIEIFVRYMGKAAFVADTLCSPKYAASRLRMLTLSPIREIAEGAKLELAARQ